MERLIILDRGDSAQTNGQSNGPETVSSQNSLPRESPSDWGLSHSLPDEGGLMLDPSPLCVALHGS